jgi:hypothetical protein
MGDIGLTLRINADGSAAVVTKIRRLADETDQAGKRMGASFGVTRAAAESISNQLRQAREELYGRFIPARAGNAKALVLQAWPCPNNDRSWATCHA